jgi:hypothetical protein
MSHAKKKFQKSNFSRNDRPFPEENQPDYQRMPEKKNGHEELKTKAKSAYIRIWSCVISL